MWRTILLPNGVPKPFAASPAGDIGVPYLCSPSTGSGTGLATPFICPSTGSGTGIPLIPEGGISIVGPDGPECFEGDLVGYCSAVILYTDVELPQIGCTKKILRTFEVREWYCGEEIPATSTHVIEIKDDMPPVIECPVAFTITTNDDCAGDITLPPAVATDGCDNGTNVSIEHPWGVVEGNGGTATLEVGTHILTYKVADDCYNFASCSTTVTIRDNTEPVAICEQFTVVSISQDGNTFVSSDVFDELSTGLCNRYNS